jgi:hypothetical protein
MNKKNLTLIFNYDKFYVYFRNGRKVISYGLCRVYFLRRLYGYDGRICIFLLSLSQFDRKWRTSVLFSGLITFIAAVHYFYMRLLGKFRESPTFFRYVDCIDGAINVS